MAERDQLKKELEKIRKQVPRVMIMKERPNPRAAHILVRGAYDKPGARVQAGPPGSLPPFESSLPGNRLGLAKWLVDPRHPLTARVTVNRHWQMFFGGGLVKTAETLAFKANARRIQSCSIGSPAPSLTADGTQSAAQAHRHQLDVRQSSTVSPALLDADRKMLLARGTASTAILDDSRPAFSSVVSW